MHTMLIVVLYHSVKAISDGAVGCRQSVIMLYEQISNIPKLQMNEDLWFTMSTKKQTKPALHIRDSFSCSL